VSSLCAESARCVGTACRSGDVPTLLQLLQSVSSASGAGRSRGRLRNGTKSSDVGSGRNGAKVSDSTRLCKTAAAAAFPVGGWLQCACAV